MLKKQIIFSWLLFTILFFALLPRAIAQQGNLNQLLDSVDKPSAWAKTPLSDEPAQRQNKSPLPTGAPDASLMMRRQMLKMMLNEGSSSPSSSAKSFTGSSSAYSDWQKAENEASRAHNYAQKARYQEDRWARKDSASQANYAADAARYAS